MKHIIYFMYLFAAGLFFSCTSQSGNEQLLRTIMENRMSDTGHKNYSQSQSGDIVTFETDDNGFFLQGNLKEVNDYKEVTLLEADNDASRYLTALFAEEGGTWQSIFDNELEAGILDTIIDLNNDNVNEIIMQYTESNIAGWERKMVIYTRKDTMKYQQIGSFAPEYHRGSAYNMGSSTIEFLEADDFTRIFVNTRESDTSAEYLGEQRLSSYFYWVNTSGGLEQIDADDYILSRDPLLVKFTRDGLWGIYRRTGDTVLIKSEKLWELNARTNKVYSKTREVLPAEYFAILALSEDLIPVINRDNDWGFVDTNGEMVISCSYHWGVSKFKDGKAVVRIALSEDWRTDFRYIDNKGNDIGSFFDKIDGNDCADAQVAENEENSVSVQNCPNGVLNYSYELETYGEEDTYYPNVSLNEIIAEKACEGSEFSDMLKKFDGNPLEYSEGDYRYSIEVEKAGDSELVKVIFSKNSNIGSGSFTFEVKETGVMFRHSYGE